VAACVALTSLVCLSACGDSGNSARADSSSRTTDLEAATPRGLAAGLLAHLSEPDVTYVGGSDEGGALSVMVGTDNPNLKTVHLYVQVEPDVGATPCGADFGYRSMSCDSDDVSTTEVLVRKNGNDEMPDLMGRFFDASRKSVLVQVWGSSGDDAASLVRDLLKDPLLGALTSKTLNEEGEQLSDFEHLQIERSASAS
jgi:hypothetical protein